RCEPRKPTPTPKKGSSNAEAPLDELEVAGVHQSCSGWGKRWGGSDMRWIRSVVSSVAVVLALAPTTAFASTNYHEAVSGIETGYPYRNDSCPAPNSISPFACPVQGTIDDTFQFAVCHTALYTSAYRG